jgi:Ca-activated chloride channel family protein
MAGPSTAIGDGLATAIKRLKDLEAKSKIIILLTDGSNNAGSVEPLAVANAAKTLGVKVYTIGVGSKGKAPFAVDGFFGKSIAYQEVEIDEKLLQEVASITGGAYFRAIDTDSLVKIYATIDQLEKTKVDIKEYVDYQEAYFYFMWPSVILVALELLLSLTRYRKIP